MQYRLEIKILKNSEVLKVVSEVVLSDSKWQLNNIIRDLFNRHSGTVPRKVEYIGGGNYHLYNKSLVLIGLAKTERI